ncbi:unnamed protein product [Caenorhabditis bovis]|uniref:Uncharacterized protein n=1 Tax=Caenorhabditis bovis TaxID=2654633 RepID=A0A8S1F8W9_9PELO|nr:unnamed protein product [Caenorhabditis bovis]
MNSRRQRYFRARSPGGRELDVLEQDEIVMEGDADGQEVSHEEIVDDDGRDDLDQQSMQYDNRPYQYTVPPAPPRRPGRPQNRYIGGPPVDVVQKLQSKNIYAAQRGPPPSRISAGGARIISLPQATRKREGNVIGEMMVKRIAGQQPMFMSRVPLNNSMIRHEPQQQSQRIQQQSQQQQADRGVKVVRLVANSNKVSPQMAEQALIDIEERIKQTTEESKIDMEKIKVLQEQEMTTDEYHSMLGYLIGEVDRLNTANTSLTDYYRQRQRNEKIVFESREDLYAARIRQLETENRKLRDALLLMYQTRIEGYEQQHLMVRHEPDHNEEHMGPIMEGEGEHVVLEEHVGGPKQEEVPPEWIVEETVDEIHHVVQPEEQQQQQEQQLEEQEEKCKKGEYVEQ